MLNRSPQIETGSATLPGAAAWCVAGALWESHAEPNRWLVSAARSLARAGSAIAGRADDGAGTAVMLARVLIAEELPGGGWGGVTGRDGWWPVHGPSGGPDDSADSTWWPAASLPEHDGVTVVEPAAAAAPAGDSAARLRRVAMGLERVARAAYTVAAAARRERIYLELHEVAGQPWPEGAVCAMLGAVGPALAEGYRRQVVEPRIRRLGMLSGVSPAQQQILALLVEGRTEREIAAIIHRSRHTVHDHVKSIYAALHISSRFELRDLWQGRRQEPAPPAAAGRTPETGGAARRSEGVW